MSDLRMLPYASGERSPAMSRSMALLATVSQQHHQRNFLKNILDPYSEAWQSFHQVDRISL